MSFGIIQSAFNPRNLSNTVLWQAFFDPNANGIEPASSTALSVIQDRSASNFAFTQASGGAQPLYMRNVVGNRGAVLFDGVNDFFSRANTAALQTTDMTLAAVVSTSVLDTDYRSHATTRNGFGSLYGYAMYRLPNNEPLVPNTWFSLLGNGGGTWAFGAQGPVAVVNAPTLIIINVISGVATLYVNGVEYNSGPYNSGIGITAPTHFIGCGGNDATPGLFWSGYIFERVQRSVGSNSDELEQLTTYMMQGWGIS